MIGPEWVATALDLLLLTMLLAVVVGGLFYGLVRVTDELADGFGALARYTSRPRASPTEDASEVKVAPDHK
jgi:hypothetical protein